MKRVSAVAAVLLTGALLTPAAAGAAEPKWSLSPWDVVFGFETIGVQSAPKTVTLSNTGDAAGTIGGVSIRGATAGDYAMAPDGCSGATVAPGGSCAVGVTFKPVGHGTRIAHLRFDVSEGCTIWATLAGSAVGPTAHIASCTTTTTQPVTQTSPSVLPGTSGVLIQNSASSSRRCSSRRKFAIRLKPPKMGKLKRVTATLAGKPVKVRFSKGRWRATIDLRLLKNGRYKLRAKYVYANGRKASETRAYSTCVIPRKP